MEEQFYRRVLEEKYNLQVRVPSTEDRADVDSIIFNELCLGKIREESRLVYQRIVRSLAEDGCQAIILGCTEISMLLSPQDTDIRLYDTTEIHADQAVLHMLE